MKTWDLNEHLVQNTPNPSGLDLVIGMRYHACVWAALNAIPFLGLAYDQKVISLAKDLDQEVIDLSTQQVDVHLVSRYISKIKENRDFYCSQLKLKGEKLRKRAQDNSHLLEGVLA